MTAVHSGSAGPTPAQPKEINPDELLRHCMQAVAMNNANLLAVTFLTLDKHLRQGGRLPKSWGNAVGPVQLVIEDGHDGNPTYTIGASHTEVVDKRGQR